VQHAALQEAVKGTVELAGVVVVVVGLVDTPKEAGDVELAASGERGRRVQQHSRTDDRISQSKKEYIPHFSCGKEGELYDI
jgi:hypothetical protein